LVVEVLLLVPCEAGQQVGAVVEEVACPSLLQVLVVAAGVEVGVEVEGLQL
jgi:hypothetical protein